MPITTYEEFQALPSSEKIGLVMLDSAKRQVVWAVVAGSIYDSDYSDAEKIVAVEDDSVALTEVFTSAVTAGEYYHDKINNKVVLRLLDSSDPTDSFIAVTSRHFFSNTGVRAPHDLSTGFSVEWLPMLSATSLFTLQIDNQKTQLGSAIEGPGTVTFHNDQAYWKPRYDKFVYENQECSVYSWNRELPITEARLLFRGKVQGKRYTTKLVSFTLKDALNELRQPLPLPNLEDFSYTHAELGSISARVPDNAALTKQRLVYGRLNGHALQNVDRVLADGYPIQGTIDVTNGSPLIQSAAGTDFPNELASGDKVVFANDITETQYTISRPTSVTAMYLSEDYAGPTGTTTAQVFPQVERQFLNRYHLISNHALTRPITTITTVFTARLFIVVDGSKLKVGDSVVVNSERRAISSLAGVTGDLVELAIELSSLPSISDTVARSPISHLYIDGQEIIEGDHFTVDDANALIHLRKDDINSPEFYLSIPQAMGTATFSYSVGSFNVTITNGSTSFLKIGDWVLEGSTWRQIWHIWEDDLFTMTTAAGATATPAAIYRSVSFITGGSTFVTADLLGKSDDGLTTGSLLQKGPEIVQDILEEAGLGDNLNTASFAASVSSHNIGLAIPSIVSNKNSQPLRDIINKINRSIFGVLFQNQDFELEYGLIQPTRSSSALKLDRADALKFSAKSDSKSIVSKIIMAYNRREIDNNPLEELSDIEQFTSQNALLLAKTTKELEVQSVLTDQSSARIFAARWAFLLEFSKTLLTIRMKLQAMGQDINDKADFETDKLYERIGTSLTRKYGLISTIRKGVSFSEIVVDDLANAFSRCAAITENTAVPFASATDSDKMVNGYMTDPDGTIGSSQGTYGINLIW